MRPKSVINTPKQDKEHPCHFYMGDPPPPTTPWPEDFRLYDEACRENSENNVRQGLSYMT